MMAITKRQQTRTILFEVHEQSDEDFVVPDWNTSAAIAITKKMKNTHPRSRRMKSRRWFRNPKTWMIVALLLSIITHKAASFTPLHQQLQHILPSTQRASSCHHRRRRRPSGEHYSASWSPLSLVPSQTNIPSLSLPWKHSTHYNAVLTRGTETGSSGRSIFLRHRTRISNFHYMTTKNDEEDSKTDQDKKDNEIDSSVTPVLPRRRKPLKSLWMQNRNLSQQQQLLQDQQTLLEIRLDTTLLSCFVLSRFLWYDLSLPPKSVPQFEIQDIIMLVNVGSSMIVLCSCWTFVGLFTGIFIGTTTSIIENEEPVKEQYKKNHNDNNDREDWVWLIEGVPWMELGITTLLVGPLWLWIEIWFQWPPSIYNNNPGVEFLLLLDDTATSNSKITALAALKDTAFLTTTMFTGCIGLFATMSIGKIVSKFVK